MIFLSFFLPSTSPPLHLSTSPPLHFSTFPPLRLSRTPNKSVHIQIPQLMRQCTSWYPPRSRSSEASTVGDKTCNTCHPTPVTRNVQISLSLETVPNETKSREQQIAIKTELAGGEKSCIQYFASIVPLWTSVHLIIP